MTRAELPELYVPFCTSDPARPWNAPPAAARFALADSFDGRSPRLSTEAAIFRDDRNLVVIFSLEDEEDLVATMFERDAPLWEEDVVELFLAPRSLDQYYEIEVNLLGTLFDARVDFPGPSRKTMQVDTSWNCRGLAALIRSSSDGKHLRREVRVTVPFASLNGNSPQDGDLWRGNFYRIDRSPHGDSFCAWSPTEASPPDFHVPNRFGTLRF